MPPKVFLEQPFPSNLWTVPACHDCNQSFKADDDYTRTILTRGFGANWNYAAQSNLPAVMRSLQYQNAQGFATYISKQSRLTNVLTPSGEPIVAIEPDWARIDRSGLHILRGLYFRETGNRLCVSSSAVRISSKTGPTSDDPDMQEIARAFSRFPDHRKGELGTAFSYTAAFGTPISVPISIWLILLYDYFFWLGTVDERDASDRMMPTRPL